MTTTVATSPAKICLAGEYSDWMGGQALVASLASLSTRVEITDRLDASTHYVSSTSDQGSFVREIDLDVEVEVTPQDPLRYVLAVLQEFHSRHRFARPFTIAIESTIPTVGGLSSSAAPRLSLQQQAVPRQTGLIRLQLSSLRTSFVMYHADGNREK